MLLKSSKRKENKSARLPLYVTRRFFPKTKVRKKQGKTSKKGRSYAPKKTEQAGEIKGDKKICEYIAMCKKLYPQIEQINIKLNEISMDLDQTIFDDDEGKHYFKWGIDKFSREYGETFYQELLFLGAYRDTLRRALREYKKWKQDLAVIGTHPTSIDLPPDETASGMCLKIEAETLVLLFKDSIQDTIIYDETGWKTNRTEEASKELWEFATSTAREFLTSILGPELCSVFGELPKMNDAVSATKMFTLNKKNKIRTKKIREPKS